MSLPACESKTQITPFFPIGWYSIARASELRDGEVKAVTVFDRELALYRSRSGQAVVVDAFCPHLGTHLGHEGRVIGESLRCPFHGWKFGADGVCNEIPYCDEIPERAKIRSWHVSEANGDIMVWFYPEDKPPQFEMTVIEELNSDEWSQPQYWEFTVPNHVQNIAENVCDPEHFLYVHGSAVDKPEVTIDEDGRSVSNAATLIGGTAANCTWDCNDGDIRPWRNSSLALNHLSAAGFYSGPAPAAEVNARPTAANAPSNPFGGFMHIAHWNRYADTGTPATVLGVYTGDSIPSAILAEIDRKIDDGLPQTGSFRAGWPADRGGAAARCFDATTNAWLTTGTNCAGGNFM